MSLVIGNMTGVVFFGPRDQPKAVRWWAERGQLHWEDSRTNAYDTVSVREFLLRLQGISDAPHLAEVLADGREHQRPDLVGHHRPRFPHPLDHLVV